MKTFLPLSRLSILFLGFLFLGLMCATSVAQPVPGGAIPGGAFPGNGGPGFGAGPVDPATAAQPFMTQINPSFPGRMWFSYTGASEGLGWDTGGFFTMGSKLRLGTDLLDGRWLMEARGHLAHEGGNVFGNLGVERIFTITPAKTDVGVNFFVDVDGDQPKEFGHTFWGLGVGGFLRHEKFELRANGYIPVGTTGYRMGAPGECFFGHNILVQHGIDTALQGADFEVTIRPWHWQMLQGHLDVGGYYYADADEELTGIDSFGGVRVRGRITTPRGVSVEAEYNYDERFKATLIGRLVISTEIFGQYSRTGQDLDRTIRNDHVVRVHQTPLLAINPTTGLPYFVNHVDNTAAPGGDGSVETPFDMLADVDPLQGGVSAPDDIIFVREGDGTTTGQDTGITLQDRQMLLGDGVEHYIPLASGGNFRLCNDVDGNKPIITGPDAGDVVTLADGNTVAGFIIDGGDPSANGVVGMGITDVIIRDNMFRNLTEDGVQITTIDGEITITGNMFETIRDDAIDITDINSLGETITISSNIIGSTLNGITDDGIHIEDYVSENLWLFDSNTITNVGGDGIELLTGTDTPLLGTGGVFSFTGNVIDTTGEDGISIIDNADPEAIYVLASNAISNAALAAIHLENLASTSFSLTGTTFSSNTVGFQFEQSNGLASMLDLSDLTFADNVTGAEIIASNGSIITVSVTGSTIEDNTGDGMRFIAETDTTAPIGMSTIIIDEFADNLVQNNGGRGVAVLGEDDTIIDATFRRNMFLNNAMGGLVVDVDGGRLDLLVGGIGKGNVFDGNGGVGVGVVLRGDAKGVFHIDDNIVINTVDDPTSTLFNGEGIHVHLAGNNSLVNSTAMLDTTLGPSSINFNMVGNVGGVAMGNVGDGILVYAEDETMIGPGTGGMAALEILSNVSSNNGDDGLNIVADDSAMINDVLISLNIFDSNAVDGIDISAMQQGTFTSNLPFGIIDNEITNNTVSGINLFVQADGQIDVDIMDNLIDMNGDGILVSELVNSTGDLRSVKGSWTFNTITRNTANGINFLGSYGGDLTFAPFFDDPIIVADNIIDSNALYGVQILGAGEARFLRNEITNNGGGGTGGGVNIAGVGVKNLDFQDNLISFNVGHGMTIVNNNNGLLFPFYILAEGNTIEGNTRRGVNIFNQGTAVTTATFIDNKIASNGEEGFYVVNTASTTQDPDAVSTAALAADGAVTATPFLILTVDDNLIINNGALSGLVGTGLVMRVGTAGGGYGFAFDGGFFGDGFAGVGATVTDNTITGNQGDDIFIHSFVSTVAPAATTGTWTDQGEAPPNPANDVFTVTSYSGDPLARLDLGISGNTVNSFNVNNTGAFYNNNEAVFKSRTTGQTPGGPFTSGTRERNATRLAARNVGPGGTKLPPGLTIGASDTFLYAGLGQSTFRLLPGSDPTPFLTDFFYVDVNDANGVTNGLPTPLEFMPYGWNEFGGNPRPQ